MLWCVYISMIVCVCMNVGVHMPLCEYRSQRTTLKGWFSPFLVALGIGTQVDRLAQLA